MYTDNFISAFNCSMLFEVGYFWNPNDIDVINGSIDTPIKKKKVGYVDIDGDTGKCTKYGISQASHPSVNIDTLTLADAQKIYYNEYWLSNSCDKMELDIAMFLFDTAINCGNKKASIMLQQALGFSGDDVDGVLGPMTLNAIGHCDVHELINKYSSLRIQFYKNIVADNPSQSKFLSGWTSRVYALSNKILNS